MNSKTQTMKRITQSTIIIILLLFTAACGIDYTITTRIFPDGSCERTMTARLDSSDLKDDLFFIPIDSSWEKQTVWELDTMQKKKIAIVTVKKRYSSVEEMNSEFYEEGAISETQNIRIELKKKFRWFYTLYRYEETYIQHFPFRNFPLTNYLNEEEIAAYIYEDPAADSIYYAGKDSLEKKAMENKLDQQTAKYIADNIFEELYKEIIRTSEKSSSSFFDSINLPEEKENLSDALYSNFTFIGEAESDTCARQLLHKLDSLYDTHVFTDLVNSDSLAFNTFDTKLKLDFFSPANEDYEHFVELPGVLLNTNANAIIEGKPQWKFDLMRYVFSDYTMWAESKKTNKWAFAVTIAIIILAVILPLLRKIKK
jgi:hypothetical protein